MTSNPTNPARTNTYRLLIKPSGTFSSLKS
jgi:hypothetical protein